MLKSGGRVGFIGDLMQTIYTKIKKHNFPKLVRELLRHDGVYLCGGAIRSIYLDKPVKDYDLFFTKEEALKNALKLAMDNRGIFTPYTITIENVQLIYKKIYKTPNDILDDFDFHNVMTAYNPGEFVVDKYFKESNDNRIVEINCITKPIKSLERLVKYKKMGFDIDDSYRYICEVMLDKGVICLETHFYE